MLVLQLLLLLVLVLVLLLLLLLLSTLFMPRTRIEYISQMRAGALSTNRPRIGGIGWHRGRLGIGRRRRRTRFTNRRARPLRTNWRRSTAG